MDSVECWKRGIAFRAARETLAVSCSLALPASAGPGRLFQSGLSSSLEAAPVALLLLDVNLDGRLDAASLGDPGVGLFLGDPTTLFASSRMFQVGGGPITMAPGDLNGDRCPALVLASGGSSTVSVL